MSDYETPDAPAPEPAVTRDELVAGLCEAVGLDPDKVHGFRLLVMAQEWPVLEVLPALPAVPGGVARSFMERLQTEAQRSTLVPDDHPTAELLRQRDESIEVFAARSNGDGTLILPPGVTVPEGAQVAFIRPVELQYTEEIAEAVAASDS